MSSAVLNRKQANGIAQVKLRKKRLFTEVSFIYFFLGYYVVAGIPIQIDIVEQRGPTGWSARIGCHSDDLGVCFEKKMHSCHSFLE